MTVHIGGEADDYLPPHVIDYWLNEIEVHSRDEEWLYKNEGIIYKVLGEAIRKEQRATRGSKLLFGIIPVMLLGQHPKDWDTLLSRAMLYLLDLKNNQLLAEMFVWIAQSYLVNGRTRAARTAIYNAFDRVASQPSEDLALLAYIVLFRCETYEHTGEFNETQANVALALAHRLRDKLLTPMLYQSLSGAYVHQGKLKAALAYGMTALGFWYNQRNPSQIAKTALMIATAYRYAEMYSHAQEALQIAQRHIDPVNEVRYWAMIEQEQAVLDYHAHRYEEGLLRLGKVEPIFIGEAWARHLAMTHHMIGLSLTELGKLGEARHYLTKALESWQHQHNLLEQVNVMYDIAALEAKDNNLSAAYHHANTALELCKKLPDKPPRKRFEELLKKLIESFDNDA